jgi:hypothetical protein
VFWGVLSSFVVFFLFFNLQAISHLAPESVKNGDTPGAFVGVALGVLFLNLST